MTTSTSTPTRILFLGSGAFGLPTLKSLAASDSHQIVGVVSQPDRPAGRGGKLTPTPISEYAASSLNSVPLWRAEDVNVEPILSQLRAAAADIWLIIAFGQKLSPALLDGKTAINLHASLLPRWRGAAPINAGILGGDAHTGNSVITLAQRMDAGLVLGQSHRPIGPAQTAGELHDLLSDDGPALVQRVIADIMAAGGQPRGQAQDEHLVTKARKLSRADAWVDFHEPAESCRRRINGLSPWPGVTVKMDGKDLKILRCQVQEGTCSDPPGVIIDSSTGVVACGEGSILRMLDVQAAGGRPMTWVDLARGRRPAAGSRLEAGRPTC